MEPSEDEVRPRRVLLVAVDTEEYDVEALMVELYEFTRSAGAEPFGSMVQKRSPPDSATCVGSGMAEDIADYCTRYETNLLIFDCKLSPIQIRNLDELTKVHVIDRTTLILDIFVARAESEGGKLQVESAQPRYLLPRLSDKGIAMLRPGGGIDTCGPDETKLETDRRHIRRKIEGLKEQLEEVEKHREQTNHRHQKDGVITVALVGCMSAGKSTLMNYLIQAGVLAKDQLFATLNPTARTLKLPSGVIVMLIDTAGFVRRLPYHLVNAFRSMLEQAVSVDSIPNVRDASSPEAQTHLEVTRAFSAKLGWKDRPVIPMSNKCDLVPELGAVPMIGNAVRISTVTGTSIDELLEAAERDLSARTVQVEALLSFAESGLAARVHKDGALQEEEFMQHGLRIVARVGPELLGQFSHYLVDFDKPKD